MKKIKFKNELLEELNNLMIRTQNDIPLNMEELAKLQDLIGITINEIQGLMAECGSSAFDRLC